MNEDFCFFSSCPPMWVGEYCQHRNPCATGSGPRCQNGGTCHVVTSVTSGPRFTCTCPIGYSASLCELPVPNACDSQPCTNGGTCRLRTLDNYTCECPPGFRGSFLPLLHATRTIPRVNLRDSFWIAAGEHCELVDYCASAPCRNGAQCMSRESGYECKCAMGFTGPTCTADVDECKRGLEVITKNQVAIRDFEGPCLHGGECYNTFGSYK